MKVILAKVIYLLDFIAIKFKVVIERFRYTYD